MKEKLTFKSYKEKYEGKAGFFSVIFMHPLAFLFDKIFIMMGITPNQITFMSLVIGLLASFFISTGNRTYLIVGAVLIMLSFILDSCDGDVARYTGLKSKKGSWLDFVTDEIKNSSFIIGISIGLFRQTNDPLTFFYGLLALFGLYITFVVIEGAGQRLKKGSLKTAHANIGIVKKLEKLGFKREQLAITIDIEILIVSLLVGFNKLSLALAYYIIIKNIYWFAFFIMVWIKHKE